MAQSGSSGERKSNALKGAVCGGITGGIEICISFPTDYVKTQLQLDGRMGVAKKYTGPIDCVKKTVRSHGILGLYRGLSVSVSGAIPKIGVRFGTFEQLKSYCIDEHGMLSARYSFLCGMGAGVSEAIFVVTPSESIKVKVISDQSRAKPKFRGIFHGVSTIVRKQGLRGVYQGLVPTVLKQGSNQAIRFFVVEMLKDQYRGEDKKLPVPTLVTGVFGALGGAASAFGNSPIDVVKTRLQGFEAHKYRGTVDCIIQIARNEGFKGFYKGISARLSRVCLEVAITFMLYDNVAALLNRVWK